MLGLMQQRPLLISSLLAHAARHHADAEVVSATGDGGTHHATWAETERRARRLVRVLQGLGVKPQDRVGTLAWNDHRHLEIYYATSGMEAICHTINPRLAADDIAYIINHAGDSVLFVDPGFAAADRRHRRKDQGQRARRGGDDRRGGDAGAGSAERDAPALLRRR